MADTEIPPHVSRMIDEREQLNERIVKLGDFFSTPLFLEQVADERSEMQQQYEVMKVYLSFLDRRLTRAGFGAG